MRKRTWILSLIVVLCVAMFPGTLFAAVTVNPVSSTIHPGSPINITGTSDLSEVIIKVYRPDHSILYFNVAEVVSGVYSDTITLGEHEVVGTYQIQVGQGEQISTTPMVVTAGSTVATVVKPTASPVGGAVASGTKVTLSSLTTGAAIYYTIDGSSPTRSSILYSTPIVVSSAQTIKAIAVYEGMVDSGIMSAIYSITSSSDGDGGSGGGTGGGSGSGTGAGPTVTLEPDIYGPIGGEVASKRAKITFPSNALSGNIKVKIEQVTDVSSLLTKPKTIFVGDVLSITKDQPGNFDKFVTITMFVDMADIDTNKYKYAIHWFNEVTKEWVVLDNTQFNPVTGQISGDVKHFTMFAVLATEKEAVEAEETKTIIKDIKGHWAEKQIQQLVDLGAITGYTDGTFLPNKTITRAEFVQVLVKAYQLEQQGSQVFLDTKGHWAEKQISTAISNEIVSGYDAEHFGPNDPITREQITLMIMRAAKLAPETDLSSLTDHAEISSWAQGSVAALVQKGIISGYSDGSFRPLKPATRAEAVTMILNSIE